MNSLVDCGEVILLIENEARYAASIFTDCVSNFNVENLEDTCVLLTVRFTRLGISTQFALEVDANGKYMLDRIKEDVENSCKTAISVLIEKSYKKERFVENEQS